MLRRHAGRARWFGVAILALASAAASACGSTGGDGDSDASTAADAQADAPTAPDAAATAAPDAAADASADAPGVDARPDATADAAPDATADAAVDAAPDATVDAAPEAGPPDAGPPAVRYIGRFDTTPAAGPRGAYAASRAQVRFEGTEVSATLEQTNGFGGGPSYFDIYVDGVMEATPLVVTSGVATQTVVAGLPAGTHTVELVKRTEGNYGAVQFRGFTFPGGGRLLPPPPARTRKLEIMGNSVINGYGILGAGPVCTPNAGNQNTELAAPPISAAAVGADLVFLGVSGKGITKNYSATDTVTLPVIFNRTLPQSAAVTWNHADFVPDAFVLFATGLDAEVDDSVMRPGYLDFIGTVRGKYPSAHIFLIVPATATDNYPAGQRARSRLAAMTQYVVTERAALGDTKVYAYSMTEYVGGQITGCDYHPNDALQAQMAAELTGWLRARLGW